MIALYDMLISVTLLSCASLISAVQREYKVGAREFSHPHRNRNLANPIGRKFESSIVDSSGQATLSAENTALQQASLRNTTWPHFEADAANTIVQGLAYKTGPSVGAGFTFAKNISSQTTLGAVHETFFGSEAMRKNVLVGFTLIIAVVIFEAVHTWSSGIDFTAKLDGLEDVQEERAHGMGPFRGAMHLWGDYIREDKSYFYICIAMIVALILLHSYAQLLLVTWASSFWDEVAVWAKRKNDNNIAKLNALLLEFLFFAFLWLSANTYTTYVTAMFNVRVRGIMTYKFTKRWLTDYAHYHLLLPGLPYIGAGNPDQRIQEDIANFIDGSLNLGTTLFTKVMQLFLMSGVLYNLSPKYVLGIEGWTCAGWLVYAVWLYSILATCLIHLVAWRLEPLSYYNQRVEADFRWELGIVRRYSEQIALTGGEALQQQRAHMRFELIRRCVWEKMIVNKRYQFVLGFFAQVETIASFFFLGPAYLKGQITLGVVMSGQRATNYVSDSTMYFANSYSDIVAWRASTARLVRFEEAMLEQSKNCRDYVMQAKDNFDEIVSCKDLTIWKPGEADKSSDEVAPERAVLFDKLNFSMRPGQKVLLSGPSGKGKTSLLRTLVGAWPFVEGQVTAREKGMKSLCFPSEVYLPPGELRSIVAYPLLSKNVCDADIKAALRSVGLEALLRRGLDCEEDWSKALSDGQKARISFARLILQKPTFAAMDEPLAHLDEASQSQVLAAVSKALPADASLLVVHHGINAKTRTFFNAHYRLDVDRKTLVTVDDFQRVD